MTGARRSAYRPEAVRRYMEGRERSVLPRFVSPRIIVCLWLLLEVCRLATCSTQPSKKWSRNMLETSFVQSLIAGAKPGSCRWSTAQ